MRGSPALVRLQGASLYLQTAVVTFSTPVLAVCACPHVPAYTNCISILLSSDADVSVFVMGNIFCTAQVHVRRSAQLQCELEEQATKLHRVQAELDKAEHLLSEKDTESAIGKAAAEAAARNISALRGELKAHADAAAKVSTRQSVWTLEHCPLQPTLGPIH